MSTAAPPSPPSSSPFKVDGKTAIITGAGSGINLSFAALLLSRNCNVVLADLALRPEAEKLVAQYNNTNTNTSTTNTGASKTPRALFVPTDVTSWPALTHLFHITLQEFPDIDIVCPGAGVYEPSWSSFWHPPGAPAARDDSQGVPGHFALLDINLTHPIRATQLAMMHWLHPPSSSAAEEEEEEEEGKTSTATATTATTTKQTRRKVASPLTNPKRIVHIGSVAGQMPNLNAPLYSASKFGLHGFVRSLAPLDAHHGIRITAVAPGVVRTPLWEEHPDKMAYLAPARDGWVTPDEVAVAMLRCVEEDALVGGTILEVGKARTRAVQTLNDPGPEMDPQAGLVVRNAHEGHAMVWSWLEDETIWGAKKGTSDRVSALSE